MRINGFQENLTFLPFTSQKRLVNLIALLQLSLHSTFEVFKIKKNKIMCGIVGYLGTKQAYDVVIEGLKSLEYRGYDSSGVALLAPDALRLYKKSGKVEALEQFIADRTTEGRIGIGHTRWATHGEPTDSNAHPHLSNSGNLAMIHNGIIENYESLKKELLHRGYEFKSETDSEVLINLIEEIQLQNSCALEKAVQLALQRVEGAYAIIVMSENDPEKLVAARKSSPLAIGLGDGEYYLASDATVMNKHVDQVVYLDDEQIAICRSNVDIEIKTLEDIPVTPYIQQLDLRIDAFDKNGFDNYMLKEIYEQPRAIRDCLAGRINSKDQSINIKGVQEHAEVFKNANRIIIVSCGTSWHAGLIGEYMIESIAKIPVEVEYASEFRYRDPLIMKNDVVIAITQSGETADTLAALEIAKERGAFTFGICNVVGSSIARITDAGMYTKAGTEIGVASTKAFSTQLTALSLLALQLGDLRSTVSQEEIAELVSQLADLPKMVEMAIDCDIITELVAEGFKDASDFLYLGRGSNFPVALEGALKLKEISYIHAEGYPAAEMKHGPIALIDEDMPVVVMANQSENYEKVVSNIQEVKARKGKVIAIVNRTDREAFKLADVVIEVPATSDFLSPFMSVIPLQLLSYHIANKLGKDVDKPRNLAKSVTVE